MKICVSSLELSANKVLMPIKGAPLEAALFEYFKTGEVNLWRAEALKDLSPISVVYPFSL